MDSNYFYIFGFVGILLVAFVGFYFVKQKGSNDLMNGEKLDKHIKEDDDIVCDGDKCVIKPKYDKCDDENGF